MLLLLQTWSIFKLFLSISALSGSGEEHRIGKCDGVKKIKPNQKYPTKPRLRWSQVYLLHAVKELVNCISQALLLVKVGLHVYTGWAEEFGVPFLLPDFVLQRDGFVGAVYFQALTSCGRERLCGVPTSLHPFWVIHPYEDFSRQGVKGTFSGSRGILTSFPGFLQQSHGRWNPRAAFNFSWGFMNNVPCAFFFYFQIEKIMSSIGEGIDFSQEQQRISGSVPSLCVSVLVVLCTKRRCWLLRAALFNLL